MQKYVGKCMRFKFLLFFICYELLARGFIRIDFFKYWQQSHDESRMNDNYQMYSSITRSTKKKYGEKKQRRKRLYHINRARHIEKNNRKRDQRLASIYTWFRCVHLITLWNCIKKTDWIYRVRKQKYEYQRERYVVIIAVSCVFRVYISPPLIVRSLSLIRSLVTFFLCPTQRSRYQVV